MTPLCDDRISKKGRFISRRDFWFNAGMGIGGLALANAGLGAVHGLAGPIGGIVPAPHGAARLAGCPARGRGGGCRHGRRGGSA